MNNNALELVMNRHCNILSSYLKPEELGSIARVSRNLHLSANLTLAKIRASLTALMTDAQIDLKACSNLNLFDLKVEVLKVFSPRLWGKGHAEDDKAISFDELDKKQVEYLNRYAKSLIQLLDCLADKSPIAKAFKQEIRQLPITKKVPRVQAWFKDQAGKLEENLIDAQSIKSIWKNAQGLPLRPTRDMLQLVVNLLDSTGQEEVIIPEEICYLKLNTEAVAAIIQTNFSNRRLLKMLFKFQSHHLGFDEHLSSKILAHFLHMQNPMDIPLNAIKNCLFKFESEFFQNICANATNYFDLLDFEYLSDILKFLHTHINEPFYHRPSLALLDCKSLYISDEAMNDIQNQNFFNTILEKSTDDDIEFILRSPKLCTIFFNKSLFLTTFLNKTYNPKTFEPKLKLYLRKCSMGELEALFKFAYQNLDREDCVKVMKVILDLKRLKNVSPKSLLSAALQVIGIRTAAVAAGSFFVYSNIQSDILQGRFNVALGKATAGSLAVVAYASQHFKKSEFVNRGKAALALSTHVAVRGLANGIFFAVKKIFFQ
jgi:hypothetical protein